MELDKEFKQNWNRRDEIDLIKINSLETWWSKEKELYYLIALPKKNRELKEVLGSLENIEGLEVYRPEFLHITVKLFRNGKPDFEDVKNSIDDIKPFTVNYGELNIFPEVIFLECGSKQIRDANISLNNKFQYLEHEGQDYLPHLTLSRFNQNAKEGKINREIEEILHDFEISNQRINELYLVKDKDTEKPEFKIIEKFSLG
ncbi:MAG: 2'-5' RNA ligase family protein [Candidatus Nanohaloarchaea archaeon]